MVYSVAEADPCWNGSLIPNEIVDFDNCVNAEIGT